MKNSFFKNKILPAIVLYAIVVILWITWWGLREGLISFLSFTFVFFCYLIAILIFKKKGIDKHIENSIENMDNSSKKTYKIVIFIGAFIFLVCLFLMAFFHNK